eukprot:CAMPEP_0174236154 /NCGR_PEP_ID=MMETSP0417-20130205/5372_1 /TAXON_ID=242541 /ORGANISM="Mayorella sp, Strain BSH-02190019" /LENGTH=373 /DNA_ID=CAMNT_0015314751 /DNA_START=74 /DNA_END=1197 /DNA_ORIENTATION=+
MPQQFFSRLLNSSLLTELSLPMTEIKTGMVLLGGSKLAAYGIQNYVIGRTFHCLQYPNGLLHTIRLHTNSVDGLRRKLIDFTDPLYGGAHRHWRDVRHISEFVPPHFTEPILTASQLRTVSSGSFLLWTTSHSPIPREQVQLVTEKNAKLDPYEMAIKYVLTLPFEVEDHHTFTLPMREDVVHHLLDRDLRFLAIYFNYRETPAAFKQAATQLLRQHSLNNMAMHDENAHERRATNIAVTHGVQQRSISTPASMENRHGNSRKNSHTQDRGERTHQMSPNSTAGPESSTTQPPTRLDSQQGTCAFTLSTTHESGRSVRRSLRVVLLQNWQHLQDGLCTKPEAQCPTGRRVRAQKEGPTLTPCARSDAGATSTQ